MLVLEAGNIKKYYSDRLIVEFDSFKVYSGEKIGIVGQNGSGKSTFLDILAGRIEPDKGYVRRYTDPEYISQFSDEMVKAGPKAFKRI